MAKVIPKTGGPFRDGDKLIMLHNQPMPECCPICNSPDVVAPVTLKFEAQRAEGALFGGVERLWGWKYTGPVTVDVYFCKWHRHQRPRQIAIGFGVMAAAILYLVISFWGVDIKALANQGPGGGTIISGILVIGGLIYGMTAATDLSAVWFKTEGFIERSVWVLGAAKSYLKTLPKLEKDEG